MRKLVLWGHHVAEYQAMFDLTDEAMRSRVLEFGCGPSAVNAALHKKSQLFISCDPLFQLPLTELKQQTMALFDDRLKQVEADYSQFDVGEYGSMAAFIASRRAGMDDFFADYAEGLREKRYVPDLTSWPLPRTAAFDYALCSHYLFADPSTQSLDEHVALIADLAHLAHEVRIFPLISGLGEPSSLLGPVLMQLQEHNFGVEVREVSYSLYPQGNAMLRVWAQQCHVGQP